VDFEKDYFEESHFIGGYDLLTKINQWRFKKYRKIIKNTINHKHNTLLDIGCGYGHFIQILKHDFDVYGMDISNHAINIASSRTKCECISGNLNNEIPFDKKFDIITAISIIEHLDQPRKGIKLIYDSLNPGGIFCCEVPTVNNKMSSIIYKLFFSWDETHVFITSVEGIESLIKSVGFKRISTYSSTFPIFTKMRKFVRNFSFIFGVFQKP
jgi:2-polyprenyl-3-methyl-5-hydroxy-6-metoxy-1,4-benzoquinol methylase